jgi:hypothetical protein
MNERKEKIGNNLSGATAITKEVSHRLLFKTGKNDDHASDAKGSTSFHDREVDSFLCFSRGRVYYRDSVTSPESLCFKTG